MTSSTESKDIKQVNKGVHTIPCVCADKSQCTHSIDNMKLQLCNVIELMGPETPQFKSTTHTDSDHLDSQNISQINSVHKSKVPILPFEADTSLETTPRDFSELSTFPTDTVDVYSLPPTKCDCNHHTEAQNFYPPKYVQTPATAPSPRTKKREETFRKIGCWLGRKNKYEPSKDALDLYKINIVQQRSDDHSPPRRVIFDLIDGIPKPSVNNASTNTKTNKQRDMGIHAHAICADKMVVAHVSDRNGLSQKQVYHSFENKRKGTPPRVQQHRGTSMSTTSVKHDIIQKRCSAAQNDIARVDVYYFDHGNSAYYRTTDASPLIMTEILAEKTENYTNRFWAEFFGTIHIGFSFFTSFVLQFFRFILQSLVRPLTVGLIQLLSDYFIKPFLAVIFNAIIQPPLIFLYNIATSFRDLCDPLAEGFGYFLRELAVLFKAIRIVDVKNDKGKIPIIKCGGDPQLTITEKCTENNNNNNLP